MEKRAELGHLIGLLFDAVKGESDPGYPLRNVAETKKLAIDSYRETIIGAVIDRLQLLCEPIPADATPQWLLMRGYCDLVRVFVKNEPHSDAKLAELRVRLISSLSLIDELICRILHTVQNKTEIAAWKNIPSKPGMGFSPDQTEALIEYRNKYELNSCFDVSGWDWSVMDWLLDWDAIARAELAHAAVGSLFYVACRNLAMILSRSVFVLANGDMYAQVWYGLMKSGWFSTSASNSRMVFMAAIISEALFAMAAGDDHLAKSQDDVKYAANMLRHGFRVKHSPQPPNVFDFCSHLYKDGVAYTLNVKKMTFALLCKKGSINERASLFDDWLRDMVNHPDLQFWTDLIHQTGWLEGPTTLRVLHSEIAEADSSSLTGDE